MVKRFISAIGFLTILPVSEKNWKGCFGSFPLVGLFIGGMLVAVNYLSSFLFSKPVVDMMVIVSLVIITGGLHLDGLADTCDGFYAGKNKDDILQIMNDAHIGTMGVIGIFCILGLKFLALESIPQKISYQSLLLFPTLSRECLVFASIISKSAKNEGLGKNFIATVSKKDFVLATIITILMSFVIFNLTGLFIMTAVFLVSFVFLKLVSKKIDGITGDILGALNEIIETFVLLVLCITK